MAVRLSALRAGRHFSSPGRSVVLISVIGRIDPRAIVRMEGLAQLKKKSHDLIRNLTRDFRVCSIVPQPTTLPRAPSWNNFTVSYVLFIGEINDSVWKREEHTWMLNAWAGHANFLLLFWFHGHVNSSLLSLFALNEFSFYPWTLELSSGINLYVDNAVLANRVTEKH
jgi:hypothetical protein